MGNVGGAGVGVVIFMKIKNVLKLPCNSKCLV